MAQIVPVVGPDATPPAFDTSPESVITSPVVGLAGASVRPPIMRSARLATLNGLLVAGMCSNESPVKTELKASATSVYPLPSTPMRTSANVAMPLLGFSSVSAKLAGPGLAPSAR